MRPKIGIRKLNYEIVINFILSDKFCRLIDHTSWCLFCWRSGNNELAVPVAVFPPHHPHFEQSVFVDVALVLLLVVAKQLTINMRCHGTLGHDHPLVRVEILQPTDGTAIVNPQDETEGISDQPVEERVE